MTFLSVVMALFMRRPRLGHRIYSSWRGSWAGELDRTFSPRRRPPRSARAMRDHSTPVATPRRRNGRTGLGHSVTLLPGDPTPTGASWKVSIIQHERSRALKFGTNDLRHLAICAVETDPYTAR